jgi:hypothetical protein
VSHVIEFRCSDGIEESFTSLPYNITQPTNRFSPSISVSSNVYRFSSSRPTTAQRTFSVILQDQDNSPLYVDYQIESGEWSLPRMFRQPGTHNFEIPLEAFAGNLQSGEHNLKFRVSDGSNSPSAETTTKYIINTNPTIGIGDGIGTVTLPGTATFEESVRVTVSDLNNDLLLVSYSIDSITSWIAYKTNVSGSSFLLTFNQNWPNPRLSDGSHKLYIRVNDGTDNSNILELSVNVQPGFVPPTRSPTGGNANNPARSNSGGSTTNQNHSGSGGLSGGAIAGIAIGVLVVVVAGIVVAVLLIRKKDGGDDSSKGDAVNP